MKLRLKRRGDEIKQNLFKKYLILAISSSFVILDIFLQSYFRNRGLGIENRGVSFGIFSGWGQGIAIVVFFLFILFSSRSFIKGKSDLGLLMILIGGLGNLIPRLFQGGVWDYIYLPLLPFWFNFSDVMITGGVFLYGWREIASARVRDSQ